MSSIPVLAAFATVVLAVIVGWIVWSATTFARNYVVARRIALPIALCPIHPMNIPWTLSSPILLPILRVLPGSSLLKCSTMDWCFHDKYRLHAELGNAFTLVTPGGNEIWVADPTAAQAIMARRKDFTKPGEMYDILNVFGPNVNTVDGEDWQRHRRITAPPFNERNSALVWHESLRQANDMAKSWVSVIPKHAKVVSTLEKDIKTLALHVLTASGFGSFHNFTSGMQEIQEGQSMSIFDSLHTILANIVLVFVLPSYVLNSSLAPRSFKYVGRALREFRAYMQSMLDEERRLGQDSSATQSLMSAVVRNSDEAKGNGLSDDEVFGNIFMFNLAGHDTTANTLAYAIVLFAAYPEYQEWVYEEIETVVGPTSSDDVDEFDYSALFPRLERCLAVMYETVRLYGPAPFMPKITLDEPQTLEINNRTHVVPPNTYVKINNQALHTNPEFWGNDSLLWRPSRWLPSSSSPDSQRAHETPNKKAFNPWSGGPRVCPGMKFAQVEFVAVLMTLFRGYRLRAASPDEGVEEGTEEMQKRLLSYVENSGLIVSLQMRNLKEIGLIWTHR